jgi:hypothetical protein
MKFINKNKIAWLVLLILAVLLPISTAHADLFGIGDIAYGIIGKFFFGISWLIGTLIGFFLMVVGWFIETFLQLNEGIVNSYIVQVGFKVTLSIANLAFVAGIIIIAIATILRRETYGIKQILWKLIAAAILVNFSLVLAGAVINFSDQVTRSFMNSAFPVDGGNSSINQFSRKMMAAFGPQKVSDSVSSALSNTTSTGVPAQLEAELSAGGAGGKALAAIIAPLASSVMTVIGLVMTLIVMAVFAFMLLARYVFLTFLLILTPLIWAAWIFPSTNKYVGQWTNNFFKWTFFGPLVMFSMWLVVTMGAEIQNGHVAILKEVSYNSPGGAGAGVSDFFGNLFSGIMAPFLNGIVLVGLMVGGLMMANKMGIAGAKAGMAAIDKVKNGVTGYAKNKGKQGASWVSRKKFGSEQKSISDRLLNKAQTAKNPLTRKAAGWMARGSTGMSAMGEKMVGEQEKSLGGMTDQQLQAVALTSSGPRKIAALNMLRKNKALDGINIDTTHNDSTKKLFESYNQGKNYNDIEKTTGISKEMHQAKKRNASKNEMDGLAADFYRTFSKKDADNMQANDIFSGKSKFGYSASELKEMSQSVAYGLASSASAITPSIISKMKSSSLDIFSGIYEGELKAEIKRIQDQTGNPLNRTPMTDLMTQLHKAQEVLEKFKNSMANNATSPGYTSSGSGGTTTGTTP